MMRDLLKLILTTPLSHFRIRLSPIPGTIGIAVFVKGTLVFATGFGRSRNHPDAMVPPPGMMGRQIR